MMRLNLLPWRERQRQAALRRFRGQLVAGALLALCAVMLVDQLARQRGQQQALANTQFQAALEELDEQLRPLADVRTQHAALLARASALEGLRAHQGMLAGLFADLEGALPEGVQLLELSLESGRLQMTGLAASGAVVAQFMRDLNRSSVLLDLELKRIKSLPGGDEFLLTARVSAFWS
ncbi:TPA: PilN domain-containing protein [Pseudomonas putida]|jgi:type IV pilus assembly protein PilN|uniref:Fimbrial assembly family protein n=2 Tax=Pseudomonas putida TaxID=303 RepID=B0KN36_PSEPG|nr:MULTISPECIES: PilN domain-containing protein [Pseudomonas]ABZ01017.1 Fimbrial assembly family protein [Pseudomonas putida GB-1]APF01120.1 fimbrial protein [Pseudomonas putida]MBP0711098.1 PilN domain-containing protein [Pseudomonas sp. T34]MCE1000306.1 PilN domain-containing protein [Pseudomonas sp. NMI1173_11]MCK2190549.1 PilN domain-containing protein [Pseudomonas sp. MB04B]